MTPNTGGRPVAIIADDQDTGRLLLAECAEQIGLAPLVYGNGAEALEAALAHGAAIVLLGIEMQGLDGYTVCQRLRADPRFTSTPILMVAAQEDSAAVSLAFDAGATDFVSKPLSRALLPRRLEYTLRNAASVERIERLAYFDPLTGLPNRQRCLDTAELHFAQAARTGQAVGVVYLDLNGFKRINDTFGHPAGDAVLRTVAGRLAGAVERLSDDGSRVCLARFGGDEFVILVRHLDARARALRLAEYCRAAFEAPIEHKGLEFYSALSIGVAVYPHDGDDVATVLKHADTAMYQAKTGGGSPIALYAPAMSSRMRDWLELEARLRSAVQQERVHLVFQPKFRLTDKRLSGVEALLRWNDSEHGEISPTRFVEIAEDSGLILEMGSWVVRAACRQLRKWLDAGFVVPVAINVSGKELLHGDPVRVVEAEAAAAGVPPSLIELEITESVLVRDCAAARHTLESLRKLGCRIALDDFGTGYSSLAYITRFPPDRIKIDKAFVRNVDCSASDAAVANAILSLADTLNIVVTAEGVERQSQLEWLRARGCDEAQGFLLSRPLSAAQLEEHHLRGAFAGDAPRLQSLSRA